MALGRTLFWSGLLVTLTSACSSSTSATNDKACGNATCAASVNNGCPDGFMRDAATGACLDVTPSDDCAAGTAAFIGSTTCAPVGWSSCAPPFEPDPSGWGCVAAIAKTCSDGTAPKLGTAACVPVGDCNAAFPPPGATKLVDATLTTTDATHFKTIFAAVSAANKGDVIAVAPGTYVEDIDVIAPNISIVGKCAAEVTIKNPGDTRPGILVAEGATGIHVRGVTLTGHMSGILVKAKGEATLEDSLIVQNRYLGAYVAEAGSSLTVSRTYIDDVVQSAGKFGWGAAAQEGGALTLDDVTIDAATGSGVVVGGAGSTGKLTNVAVRSIRADSEGVGAAIAALDSGSITVDGAMLENIIGVGLHVEGGSVSGRHVVVSDTSTATTTTTPGGRGVQVTQGGHLNLTESAISLSDETNLVALGSGTTVKLDASVVRGDVADKGSRGDYGVRIVGGATLDVTNTALVSNLDVGLAVQDPGTQVHADHLLVTDTRLHVNPTASSPTLGVGVGVSYGATLMLTYGSVVKNHTDGVFVSAADASGAVAHANLISTLVRRTQPNADGTFGRGIEVSDNATATLDGCAIAENNELSMLVGESGSLTVTRSIVRDTKRAAKFGHGAVASDGGYLVLDDAWLLGHPGIGLAVSAASATVNHSTIATSSVAIQVQGGTLLTTAETVPDAPDSMKCVVSNDTRFIDNEVRTGNGELPVPSPLGTPERTH